MAADRRVTSEDGAASSLVKIAKNPWLIAAASGNATCSLDVKRAVRKGASSVEDLIEHVDAESYALVLTAEGKLWRVEEKRAWECEAGRLHAIGSGGDLALGWLTAAHDVGGLGHDKPVIRRAFEFVAKRRSDCGGGVDFRAFPF